MLLLMPMRQLSRCNYQAGAKHKIGHWPGIAAQSAWEYVIIYIEPQLHDKRFHLSLGKTMNKTQTFYTLIKLYPVRWWYLMVIKSGRWQCCLHFERPAPMNECKPSKRNNSSQNISIDFGLLLNYEEMLYTEYPIYGFDDVKVA